MFLYGLDPGPFVTSRESKSSGIMSTIWYYIRQLLLWHNAESLEERPTVAGTHGQRLKAAESLLEKAVEPAKNEDAIFLLAEMNFVSLC